MSISKSLRRANYGKDAAEGLYNFLSAFRRKKDQDQFNDFMGEAMSKIRQTYSEQPEDNPTWNSENNMKMAPPKTALGDLVPKSNKMDMTDDPGNMLNLKVKPKDPNINIDSPDYEILGNVGGVKYGTMTRDEQRMKQGQIMSDFLMKAQKLQGVDPQKIQDAFKTMQLYGSSVTPGEKKSEIKSFSRKDDIYQIDDNGNVQLIRPGEEEKKKPTSIGSYTGKDGYHYITLIGDDGKPYEVKSDNPVKVEKNGITIKMPKSEKWADFGTYINSIDYTNDENGNLVRRNNQQRKIAREIALNQAKSNLLPRALNWYQTEIVNKWNAENISQADFEIELLESYNNGEVSQEEAQDLLDFNQYRPFLFDIMRDTSRKNKGDDQ